MKNIEVEIQTVVAGKDWPRLKKFFDRNAKFLGEHKDRTAYFEKNGRIRIRMEPAWAYFVFKSGKMHDRARKEIEIKFSKKDARLAEKFLNSLGFPVQIRWERVRRKYLWNGVTVTLDDTRGYGKLLELEKMSAAGGQERTFKLLVKRLKFLRVKPTSRENLNRKFRNYIKNWRKFF